MAEQYEIALSPRAKRGVYDILRYIRSVSTLEAAVKVDQLINQGLSQIAIMPTRRAVYLEKDGIEFRSYEAQKRYRIIYTIEENDLKVAVVRIAHIKVNKATILTSIEEE